MIQNLFYFTVNFFLFHKSKYMFLVLVLLSETLLPLSEFVRISDPPPLTLASDVPLHNVPPYPLHNFQS